MNAKLTFLTALVAIGLSSGLAFAAPARNRVQDQRENAVTGELNQQQLQKSNSGNGVETYQGVTQSPNQSSTQEQIAQPPSDNGDLSIIE